MSISVIVLAAGKGTRMKSELPKVLHHVLGKTLLSHVFDALSSIDNKFVVVGHESDLVINSIPSLIKNVIQKEQLGTGHAVSIAINSEVFKEIK
jgi:bifunctional UDP-N-acetylglucosamine pyrophosphorylase/glucosamine-1-phosphate N-acetyltransferase